MAIVSLTARHALITLANELGLCVLNRPLIHPRFGDDERATAKLLPFISKRERRWWRRRGFTCDKSLLFDRTRLHEYIDDLSRYVLFERINLRYRAVMIEKSVFDRYCGAVTTVVPLLAVLQRDEFYPSPHPRSVPNLQTLYSRAQSGEQFVVKPIEGGGGNGVCRIRPHPSGSGVSLDGNSISRDALRTRLAKIPRAVLQQEVSSQGYSSQIFPDVLNTMRIITMICPRTSEPFIAAASHKFGTRQSGVVDNWDKGGVLCNINIETGELGPGYLYPTTILGMERIECHPDTGANLAGTTVPNWTQFKNAILAVAGDARFLPYIGWDVAWCGKAITIVEGNTNPGLLNNQVFSPMLACDRARAFYSHFGVLR